MSTFEVRLQDQAGRHFTITIEAPSEIAARSIAQNTYSGCIVLAAYRVS